MYKINSWWEAAVLHRELRPVLSGDPEVWKGGGREAPEGGDICTLMADSRCCMAEANIILESNYPPIKKKINMVLVTS